MKKLNKAFTAKVLGALLMMCLLIVSNKGSGQVAGWDVNPLPGGNGNYGPQGYLPTLTSSYVTIGGLTRGSGVGTTGTAAQRAWGGNGWTAGTSAAAIIAGDYFTFTIRVDSSYPVSLTSISPFDYRRSGTGPDSGLIQYSLNGVNFFGIDSVLYSSILTTGASLNVINLSTIPVLQNLLSGITVTFRIVNWGASSAAGTWYIFDKGVSTANDFQINGTVPLYFRSVQTDNWISASTWEVSSTGSAPWNPAFIAPSSNAYSIEVQTGHQVTLPTFQAVGRLLITNGSLTGSVSTSMAISGTASALRFTPGGTSNYLKDFAVIASGNVTLADTLNIAGGSSYGTITASAVLNTNGFLTLKSNALGTARVGVSVANAINGNVTIERFIPAKRAWRLLTHSLASGNTQTINSAWQEGATPNPSTVVLNNPVPLYGTQITKNRNLDLANGYDANLQANPSIFSMDNAASATIASTYTPIAVNRSYFLFIRGDRANQINQGTAAPTSTTTLRTTGTINQGDITQNITASAGQYFGVGNPYPSTIRLAGVRARSININSSTFAVWDPGINPYGGYIVTAAGISTPKTFNYPYNFSGDTVQSGQAVRLLASGSNPTVVFQEVDKIGVSSSSVFARPVPPVSVPPSLQINLYDSGFAHVDGVAIGFGDSSVTAPKLSKPGEMVFLIKQRDTLAIQIQPLQSKDTFYLEFANLKKIQYHLRFEEDLQELDAKITLVDRYIGKHMPFTKGTNGYAFAVTADTASYKNRFMVIATTKPKPVYTTLQDELFVYPNPTKGMFTINSPVPIGTVQISDAAGRVLHIIIPISNKIDCSFLESGLYVLKVGNKVTKFIKQ